MVSVESCKIPEEDFGISRGAYATAVSNHQDRMSGGCDGGRGRGEAEPHVEAIAVGDVKLQKSLV